ncbi:transglutaminase-like domain-containing protein [Rhizobium sullae]|uniref:Transglutaminase n=1 Tax=Rhizobium sullae TaxID=50338 RepID=A0A2N0CZ62_RHISU|nr:transglutaminase-like domain-containing protein [Rhizobium sullae]PKA39143.1 transglutaminase [Rhizobium sullae]UWU13906.1 transglutaminase-like domain-containing protein [Rhizobium sullae]
MEGLQNSLDFYSQAGPLTSGGQHAEALGALAGVAEVASALHGILIHDAWAQRYGQELTPARRAQSQLRSTQRMLDAIIEIDAAPLVVTRTPSQRAVGVCRHFAVLACASLRAQGIPARARCGFGMYFEPGKGVDHWITEYWSGRHWVSADFQIDDLQCSELKLDFDPLDLPRGKFLTAGEAWRLCRAHTADPGTFGIFDEGGFWFIAMNLVRDFAALNKMEMLPWDNWGLMPRPDEDISPDRAMLFDHLAMLTEEVDERFDEIRTLYQQDDKLHVPTRVFNGARKQIEDVAST